MSGVKWMRYTREFKLGVVERMLSGENVSALARDLGVRRTLLYEWRRIYLASGPSGLRGPGRPPEGAAALLPDEALGRERVAALERKIGQQQLELDFFRQALQHIEASRGQSDGPTGTASMPSSRAGRSGKAD